MSPFEYRVAGTADAALAEHARGEAMLMANGIDVLDRIKEGLESPDTVLSIGKVHEWSYVTPEGDGVRIGCLTTLAELGQSELLRERFPGLHHAAVRAATPQIRERATLGGNLCQRPRCWYFRNVEFPCLKKGGSVCYAPDGDNRYHAVLGGGPCHIVHPSNSALPLVAADAQFVLRRRDGERIVPAREFFVLPRDAMYRETVLEEGEILTEVRVPRFPDQSATVELREKQSFDWPVAAASAARVGRSWALCLGAVAPIPWLSREAAEVLGREEMTEPLAERAAMAAVQNAEPLSSNAYKVRLARIAAQRALLSAAGKETE